MTSNQRNSSSRKQAIPSQETLKSRNILINVWFTALKLTSNICSSLSFIKKPLAIFEIFQKLLVNINFKITSTQKENKGDLPAHVKRLKLVKLEILELHCILLYKEKT